MSLPSHDDDALGAAAPLDLLLTRAVGRRGRTIPLKPALGFAGVLARRPRLVVDQAGLLTAELVKIATGSSTLEPSEKDRRFADRAWSTNPVLHRVVQSYLATARTADELVADLPLEWRDAELVRFAMTHLVEAMAPSNNPFLNPSAWKEAIDTGGLSVLRGVRNLVQDLSVPPRVPLSSDVSAFTVGEDLAATPGAVVLRTEMFELLQYTPTTPTVRREPVLVVPPTINKYYVLDLAPQRSMVEHLVAAGQQVFMISWRNPGAEHRGWDIDAYVASVLVALATTQEIATQHGGTTTPPVHLLGCCSGGILAALTASHLQRTGRQDELATIALLVTLLDQARAGVLGTMAEARTAAAAVKASGRTGYVDGRRLAEVFALLRPADLIWNYWVNNYLLGRTPAAFDILAWNLDTIRMPAALHADFVAMAMGNTIPRPGGTTVLGTEVDLSQVTLDAYVMAGIADHLCPWPNCFRSAQLFGGLTRFVLSTSGHVAAMVNPPGNPKAGFLTHEGALDREVGTEEWQAAAQRTPGSWWVDLAAWLGVRSTGEVDAPRWPGSAEHPVLAAAPGSYVLQS